MSGVGRKLGFGQRAHWKEEHVLRVERTGIGFLRVGLITVVLVAVSGFLAFSKSIPWQRSFELNAVFANSANIKQNSPVRVAGINVGKVAGVTHDGQSLTKVTLELEDSALPVKRDATMKIRPLLFLEGNYFVDLKPGSPSAPAVNSEATIPVTQTATAVQFDEILTSLQADSRQDLREVLKGLSEGLSKSDGGGLTGAEALNSLYGNLDTALKNTASVSEAFLGERSGDLTRLVQGLQKTTAAFDRNEEQLKDLITNFNTTSAAFAAEADALSATVAELPLVLKIGRTTLENLNSSLPATNTFAKDIRPAINEIPETVDASPEWFEQVEQLLADDELGGLAEDLQPTVRDLAQVSDSGLELFGEIEDASVCANKVLLPTFKSKLQDPPLTTDTEVYKEFFYALTGFGGSVQNFDGNGPLLSFASRGGDVTLSLGKGVIGGSEVFANASSRNLPLGQRPQVASPLLRPPYRPEVKCSSQKAPDLAAEAGLPPTAAGGSPQ